MPVFSDQIIVYDFNNALKTNTELATVAGTTMDIFPLVAPSGQTPPFLIYYWVPGHMDVSSYMIRQDTIRYHIYDSQADRCFRIANKIIEAEDFVDVGDIGICYATVYHGVAPVNKEKEPNWDDVNDGRWFLSMYSNESDEVKNRHTSMKEEIIIDKETKSRLFP